MAGEGGVTLRIDADTAAYIAKLSTLAESHEKVTKHVEGWGGAVDHAMSKMAALAAPLVLVEELARKAGEAFHEWKEDIHHAGESTELLVNKLREATVRTGENRQQVAKDLLSNLGPVSVKESVDFFSTFRAGAPDSARDVSATQIGKAAAQARTAGFNLNEFSAISGNLYGSAGGGAFDQAAMLEQMLGGGAQDASELIKKTSSQMGSMGPEAMKELLPFLIASAKAKDRRFSFVKGALENVRPGGSITDALTRARAKGGPLGRSIFANLPAAQSAIAAGGGSLERAAGEAHEDEGVQKDLQTRTIEGQADIANLDAEGERAEEEKYAEANKRLYREKYRGAAFMNSLMPGTTVGFYGHGSSADYRLHGGDPRIRPGTSAAGYTESESQPMPGFIQPLSQMIDEQNTILRTKQMRTDAHRDEH